jgi:hypothetical protein
MNMAASMQWIQEFWSTKTPNQASYTNMPHKNLLEKQMEYQI